MNKFLVIGCAGCGKSTFSRKLGEITGIPVVHLDSLYWKPGWVESAKDEWDKVVEELIHQEQYIMDGNYARTLDLRLAEADTVFYFDYSKYLCLYRVLKRRIQNHGTTRADMADGSEERIDLEFIRWIWNFNRDNKPKIMNSLEKVKGLKQIYVFKSPKD